MELEAVVNVVIKDDGVFIDGTALIKWEARIKDEKYFIDVFPEIPDQKIIVKYSEDDENGDEQELEKEVEIKDVKVDVIASNEYGIQKYVQIKLGNLDIDLKKKKTTVDCLI